MIRVLIVDDHALVREGLARVLRRAGMEIVGTAPDGDTGIALAACSGPDVILWDLAMPGGGLGSLQRLPDVSRVLVLTALDDVLLAGAVRKAGAGGFVSKTSSPDKLADAVRVVAQGATIFPLPELTEREMRILELLPQSGGNQEIACTLGISVKTVETYLERLKDKLGHATTAELRAWTARRAAGRG